MTDSTEFPVFDELPRRQMYRRGEPVDWAAAKQALLDNPGRWVLMAENVASSTPTQLRAGRNRAFPEAEVGDYEFTTLKPERLTDPYPKRRTDLYGRYIAKGVIEDA